MTSKEKKELRNILIPVSGTIWEIAVTVCVFVALLVVDAIQIKDDDIKSVVVVIMVIFTLFNVVIICTKHFTTLAKINAQISKIGADRAELYRDLKNGTSYFGGTIICGDTYMLGRSGWIRRLTDIRMLYQQTMYSRKMSEDNMKNEFIIIDRDYKSVLLYCDHDGYYSINEYEALFEKLEKSFLFDGGEEAQRSAQGTPSSISPKAKGTAGWNIVFNDDGIIRTDTGYFISYDDIIEVYVSDIYEYKGRLRRYPNYEKWIIAVDKNRDDNPLCGFNKNNDKANEFLVKFYKTVLEKNPKIRYY